MGRAAPCDLGGGAHPVCGPSEGSDTGAPLILHPSKRPQSHPDPPPSGEPEAGIDGGGLFKDFMDELLRQGFDPEVGVQGAGVVVGRRWGVG